MGPNFTMVYYGYCISKGGFISKLHRHRPQPSLPALWESRFGETAAVLPSTDARENHESARFFLEKCSFNRQKRTSLAKHDDLPWISWLFTKQWWN